MSIQVVGPQVPEDTLEMRLVIVRAHAGVTAEQAGAMVDVSGQTWRNWEAGTSPGARKPSTLAYIARVFNVDEEWLRNGGPLARPSTGPDGGGVLCAIRDSNPEPADLAFSQVMALAA